MFLEQPLPNDQSDGMGALNRLGILPICGDECISGGDEILRLGQAGIDQRRQPQADQGRRRDAAAARRRACASQIGLSVTLAGKVAGSSISAAATLAAACASPVLDWGVNMTHVYLAEDLVRDPLRLEDRRDRIALRARPRRGCRRRRGAPLHAVPDAGRACWPHAAAAAVIYSALQSSRSNVGMHGPVDVRILKTLVAVAEHGTFAAAANVVGLSPSAVSMQIQALEQHLAAELFDRSRRPPVLNDKGMALLPTARKIIGLHDSLRDAAASPNEFVGRLRLGVIPTALSSFVPAALAGLTRSLPAAGGADRHRHEHAAVQAAQRRRAGCRHHRRAAEPAGRPALAALRQGGHLRDRAARRDRRHAPRNCCAATLTSSCVRGAWQLRMIEEQIAKMAMSLHTIMQLDSIEAVTMMVHHGLGVSIVPRRSVEPLLRLPIKLVPFGEPPLYRTLGLVQAQGSPKNHLCNAVFEQLVKVCGRADASEETGGPATVEAGHVPALQMTEPGAD